MPSNVKLSVPTLLVASTLLACGSTARAALVTVVNDSFDAYTSQSNFEATWVPIGTAAPISAELSNAQSVSTPNSVRFAPTTTSGQNRNRLTFAETNTTATLSPGVSITWSFDFYDAGTTAAASPYRSYSNLQDGTAPSASNQLISMGLNNNQTGTASGGNYFMGRILGYTPTAVDPDGGAGETGTLSSGQYFKLNDTAAGLRTAAAGWHNLKVVLSTDDGLSSDYQFYVDGSLAETVANFSTAATFRSYDNIALGSGLSNASTVSTVGTESFTDNMSLVINTPEPTTALFCLASMAVLRRRRRQA